MSEGETTRRVLVAEDEAHIRELVRLHLGLEGWDVLEAATGQDALDRLRAEPVDLVVLDIMLPGLDGITVLRAMRRGGPNASTPVLLLTARREESDKVLGLDSGADDYLTKPFGVRELVARARALMRRVRPTARRHLARRRPARRAAGPGDTRPGASRGQPSTARPSSSPGREFDLLICWPATRASSSAARRSSRASGRATPTSPSGASTRWSSASGARSSATRPIPTGCSPCGAPATRRPMSKPAFALRATARQAPEGAPRRASPSGIARSTGASRSARWASSSCCWRHRRRWCCGWWGRPTGRCLPAAAGAGAPDRLGPGRGARSRAGGRSRAPAPRVVRPRPAERLRRLHRRKGHHESPLRRARGDAGGRAPRAGRPRRRRAARGHADAGAALSAVARRLANSKAWSSSCRLGGPIEAALATYGPALLGAGALLLVVGTLGVMFFVLAPARRRLGSLERAAAALGRRRHDGPRAGRRRRRDRRAVGRVQPDGRRAGSAGSASCSGPTACGASCWPTSRTS